ncbi:MAG: serine hydrolase [Chitinophagaceae bacterium]|nr:serine hydrolase [Chitinophagaceae bacterium]
MNRYYSWILLLLLYGCSKQTPQPSTGTSANAAFYFPSTNTWETITPSSLNWNTAALNDVYTYIQQKNTKAFIILKNGKIVAERYFGTFTADSNWQWASAGKTITALLVGIAQEQGILHINNKTSQYLGTGWTSLPLAKENLITIKHQLTMTTGLDDGVTDNHCTTTACLQYKADAGQRWAYHNAPYTLLDQVIEKASGLSYNQYFQQKIRDRIGMNGLWIKLGYNNVYFSNARSMARFGLLLLAKGKWNDTRILNDTSYFSAQINSSQNINPAYGYLTWLNGKSSYMLPTLQFSFSGNLVPNAPTDLYAALGKDDQKIYVVPSQGLVVIRMGESAGQSQLALSSFDNELWGRLKAAGVF